MDQGRPQPGQGLIWPRTGLAKDWPELPGWLRPGPQAGIPRRCQYYIVMRYNLIARRMLRSCGNAVRGPLITEGGCRAIHPAAQLAYTIGSARRGGHPAIRAASSRAFRQPAGLANAAGPAWPGGRPGIQAAFPRGGGTGRDGRRWHWQLVANARLLGSPAQSLCGSCHRSSSGARTGTVSSHGAACRP